MNGHGVSLRLKAVQVLELAERKAYSPFILKTKVFLWTTQEQQGSKI